MATLDRSVVAGKLREAPPAWLANQRQTFFNVFGFGNPDQLRQS